MIKYLTFLLICLIPQSIMAYEVYEIINDGEEIIIDAGAEDGLIIGSKIIIKRGKFIIGCAEITNVDIQPRLSQAKITKLNDTNHSLREGDIVLLSGNLIIKHITFNAKTEAANKNRTQFPSSVGEVVSNIYLSEVSETTILTLHWFYNSKQIQQTQAKVLVGDEVLSTNIIIDETQIGTWELKIMQGQKLLDTFSFLIKENPQNIYIDKTTWKLPNHIKQDEEYSWQFFIINQTERKKEIGLRFINSNDKKIYVPGDAFTRIPALPGRKLWRVSKTFHKVEFPVGTTQWELYYYGDILDGGSFEIVYADSSAPEALPYSKPIENSPMMVDRGTWELPQKVRQLGQYEWRFKIVNTSDKYMLVGFWFFNSKGRKIMIEADAWTSIPMDNNVKLRPWRLSKFFDKDEFPFGKTIWQMYNSKTMEVLDEGEFEVIN